MEGATSCFYPRMPGTKQCLFPMDGGGDCLCLHESGIAAPGLRMHWTAYAQEWLQRGLVQDI